LEHQRAFVNFHLLSHRKKNGPFFGLAFVRPSQSEAQRISKAAVAIGQLILDK
jgi:hypothetical protein